MTKLLQLLIGVPLAIDSVVVPVRDVQTRAEMLSLLG